MFLGGRAEREAKRLSQLKEDSEGDNQSSEWRPSSQMSATSNQRNAKTDISLQELEEGGGKPLFYNNNNNDNNNNLKVPCWCGRTRT